MFVHVTPLRYWKSEHTADTCQDSSDHQPEKGLFVVADGVSNASYSEIWSRLLVEHFIACPLLSADPFELEWWLTRPQAEFKASTPSPEGLSARDFSVIAKAREGSYSTLLAARILRAGANGATLRLLAVGDSCALLRRAHGDGAISSFPLTDPDEFAANPVCLPSRPAVYNRHFHTAQQNELELHAGDVLILATDAVAKWVLSSPDSAAAFQQIAAIRDPSIWEQHVFAWRRGAPTMADDDSTALVLTLSDAADPGFQPLPANGLPVPRELIDSRAREAQDARAEGEWRRLAVLYGDGEMVRLGGFTLPDEERERARSTAQAWTELRDEMNRALQAPDGEKHAQTRKLAEAWQRYQPLLIHEPSASGLIGSLEQLGIPVDPPPHPDPRPSDPRPAEPPAPPEPTPPPQPPRLSDEEVVRTIERLLADNAGKALEQYVSRPDVDLPSRALPPELSRRVDVMVRLVRLRRVIEKYFAGGGDAELINLYIPDLDPYLKDSERQLILKAKELLELINEFRNALKRGDDAEIVAFYDLNKSDFSGILLLTDDERRRVAKARGRLEAKAAMQAVLDDEDDAQIVQIYDVEIERSSGDAAERPFGNVLPRVNQARARVAHAQRLKDALASTVEQAIFDETKALMRLWQQDQHEQRRKALKRLLSPEQARQAVEIYKCFNAAEALRQEAEKADADDTKVLALWEDWDKLGARGFSPDDPARKRVEVARVRQEALAEMGPLEELDTLDDGRLLELADAGRVEAYPHLPEAYRVRVEEARRNTRLRAALTRAGTDGKAELDLVLGHSFDDLRQMVRLTHAEHNALDSAQEQALHKLLDTLAYTYRFWSAAVERDVDKMVKVYDEASDAGVTFDEKDYLLYTQAREKQVRDKQAREERDQSQNGLRFNLFRNKKKP